MKVHYCFFAFAALAQTGSAQDASFQLTGGILGGTAAFAPNSGCSIKYQAFPWIVDCDVGIMIDVESDQLNGGAPVEVRATANVTIDVADIADPRASLGYAAFIGPLEVEIDSSFGTQTIDTDGEPISIDEFALTLNKDGLEAGLCLSSIPDLGVSNTVDLAIDAAQTLAEAVGSDVCSRVSGLFFSDDGQGGKLKVVLDITMFDHNKASSETIIDEIHESLDLTGPLIYSLDLGALVVQAFSRGGGRDLQEAVPLDDEGNFLLGTLATTDTNDDTPTGASADTSTGTSDTGTKDDSKDDTSTGAAVDGVISSLLALSSMAAWLFV